MGGFGDSTGQRFRFDMGSDCCHENRMNLDDGMERYEPLEAPDPEEWLAMEEDERLLLIREYVEEHEPGIEGKMMHVGMHLMVENQIALGDEMPVREVHERLMREGLDRHDAIHAVATAFAGAMFEMKNDPEAELNANYHAGLEELTAESWLTMMDDDDEGPKPVRPKEQVGRNDPCPCGSGMKFKKCCWLTRN